MQTSEAPVRGRRAAGASRDMPRDKHFRFRAIGSLDALEKHLFAVPWNLDATPDYAKCIAGSDRSGVEYSSRLD